MSKIEERKKEDEYSRTKIERKKMSKIEQRKKERR